MSFSGQHIRSTELYRGAEQCVSLLKQAGYEAYFVGGCVRDMLRGVDPYDIDISSSATPEQVEAVFSGVSEKILDHGRRFGTLSVNLNGHFYEITTFRGESEYTNQRHPSEVHWTDRKQDAARRDFTVNALFYDPVEDSLVDDFGGENDLKAGVLKAVGVPSERFKEDSLRILRALRFQSQLGFEIESKTFEALCEQAADTQKLSRERVQSELGKLYAGDHSLKAFENLCKSQVLHYLFKDTFAVGDLESLNQLAQSMMWSGNDYIYGFAVYMTANKSPELWNGFIQTVLMTKDQRTRAKDINKNKDVFVNSGIGQQLQLLETDVGVFLYEYLSLQKPELQVRLNNLRQKYLRLSKDCGKLPKPIVKADDLKGLAGPTIGSTLEKAYNYQLENEVFDKKLILRWLAESEK